MIKICISFWFGYVIKSKILDLIAHDKLHDKSLVINDDGSVAPKDRRTEEVEAESVSFSVCNYFNIETGANSFGYLAEWSKGRELKELNASLDTIRKTAAEMITAIEDKFHEIVKDRDITIAVGETQAELAEPAAAKQPPPAPEADDIIANIIEHKNYQKFTELFPEAASGEYSYLRLEAGDGFMPLLLEWIDENQISVMHTYVMNGELCYDPMIVFEVDKNAGTMIASEFQQSIPPVYQFIDDEGIGRSVDGNGREFSVIGLQDSINEFASQWLDNIGQQGYMPVKADMEINGEPTRVIFDTDGKPIIPESSKPDAEDIELFDNADTDGDPSEPEQIIPDPSIGYSEMNLYGYSYDGMLPLTQSRATELFDANLPVFLLFPDGTEAAVFDRDELVTHDGIFGIEKTDWEASLEYAAMKAETKTSESSREADLLYGGGNRFGIYQVKNGNELRDFRFVPMEELQALGLDVERGNYELVYTAPFDDRIEFLTDRYPVLNRIYEDFNISHPGDYTGRSVSVSDVITLKCNGDISSHFVDSVGFVEIDHFHGMEKTELPKQPEKSTQDIDKPKPDAYSQVGNRSENECPAAPKGKPSLAERLAENKLKASRQGQPDAHKTTGREVISQ